MVTIMFGTDGIMLERGGGEKQQPDFHHIYDRSTYTEAAVFQGREINMEQEQHRIIMSFVSLTTRGTGIRLTPSDPRGRFVLMK